MKFSVLSIFMIILISGVSSAIGIRDYNPPVSNLTSMDLSAFYNYAGGDNTEENNGAINYDFLTFYESLPFGWSIASNGGYAYNGLDDDSLADDGHTVSFAGEIHKYLIGDIYGYSSLNVASRTSYENIAADAFIGAGFGRYINATAMAKALRIQEELYEEGLINNDLESSIMIELAAAIDNISSYDIEREYYAAIQEILESSSQIDALSAVAFYRITEVLNERISDRYFGYRAGAGIGYELSDSLSEETEDPRIEIYGNFAYPFNRRSQFNQSVNFESTLEGLGDSYIITAVSTYSLEISDKIANKLEYRLVNNKALASTTHTVMDSFSYYIENNISLTVSASLVKATDVTLHKTLEFSVGYDLF